MSKIPYTATPVSSLFDDSSTMTPETKAHNQTYIDWIVQQVTNLDFPIIQIFLRPLRRSTVSLVEFCATQDIML